MLLHVSTETRKRHSDKPDCIVLAAGASRRMGRPKLHLPFGGASVLASTIESALGAGLRVIIVGRPDDALVETHARPGRVLLATNPDPERGMLSSLKAGLALAARSARDRGTATAEGQEAAAEAQEGSASGFFFIPGDMPLVRSSTYQLLLNMPSGGPLIASFRGRRGHPVLMPASLREAVLALPDEGNLRALIDASGPRLVETDDEGTVTDLDLPAEYESAAARLAQSL